MYIWRQLLSKPFVFVCLVFFCLFVLFLFLFLFLFHMNNIWIDVISCVRPADRMMIDTNKLYNFDASLCDLDLDLRSRG